MSTAASPPPPRHTHFPGKSVLQASVSKGEEIRVPGAIYLMLPVLKHVRDIQLGEPHSKPVSSRVAISPCMSGSSKQICLMGALRSLTERTRQLGRMPGRREQTHVCDSYPPRRFAFSRGDLENLTDLNWWCHAPVSFLFCI